MILLLLAFHNNSGEATVEKEYSTKYWYGGTKMTEQDRMILLEEVHKLKEEINDARRNCYIGASVCFVIFLMAITWPR